MKIASVLGILGVSFILTTQAFADCTYSCFNIGVVSEVNSDYTTAGVKAIAIGMDEDTIMFAAMNVVQRLQHQDGDRAENATVGFELGGGWQLGEEGRNGVGAMIKYNLDDLKTDTEKQNGKDFYNREGIQPGLYAIRFFGKEYDTVVKLSVTHNGEDPEVQFEISKSL